ESRVEVRQVRRHEDVLGRREQAGDDRQSRRVRGASRIATSFFVRVGPATNLMKLSSLPAVARRFAFLVALGGLGACAGGLESNAGQGGTSGQSGAAGGAAGSASCATGGSTGVATWSDVKTVVGFYCGGSGCHNNGQTPDLFPSDDATLYNTLTTYKVAKCGGRVLVKPCA